MKLRVEIIKDLEGFSTLEAVWNPLLDRSGTDSVFLTYEWIFTCWAHFCHANKLFIIVVWNGPAIIVIVPLMVAKTKGFRQLCMIANCISTSDDIDFIIDDSADKEQVVREIFDALDLEKGWDFLKLGRFSTDSANYFAFNSVWARYPSWRIIWKKDDTKLYVPIEGTFDDYFHSLKKSFRESTAKHQKHLDKKTLSYCFSDEIHSEKIREIIDEIIDLKVDKYGSEETMFNNSSTRPFFADFAEKAYSLGWLRISTMFINDENAAMLLGFQYKDKYYAVFTCYKPNYGNYSPGRMIEIRQIKRCFELGLREYDTLNGVIDYKFQYNVKARERHEVFLFRSGLKGRITRRLLLGVRMPERLRNIRAVDIMVRAAKKILKRYVSAD